MNEIDKLAEALAKAQGELENAGKRSENPHFRSKYADLAEVLNTVRPVFSRHGLSIVQMPTYCGTTVSVQTVLMHSSGQSISSTLSSPVAKQDAQGIGSAITYCRRYSLAAMAGIAQEDDDGNAASAKRPEQKEDVTLDQKYVAAIESAADLETLSEVWKGIPVGLRRNYADLKDSAKARIVAERMGGEVVQ